MARTFEELVKALRDQNMSERSRAVIALGGLVFDLAAPAIKALSEALLDVAPDVRYWAAWTLEGLGPVATVGCPGSHSSVPSRGE